MGGKRKSIKARKPHLLNSAEILASSERKAWMDIRIQAVAALIMAALLLIFTNISEKPISGSWPFITAIAASWLPISILGLQTATRVSLRHERARILKIQIGRKRFTLRENHRIATEEGQILNDNDQRDAELFIAACNVIRNVKLDDGSSGDSGHFWLNAGKGITAHVRSYGPSDRKFLFFYGPVGQILKFSNFTWDFGHERRMTAADRATITETENKWNKSGIVLALAYSPLESEENIEEIVNSDMTYLGTVNVGGIREKDNVFLPDIAQNYRTASKASMSVSFALMLLVVLSYLGNEYFQVPLILNAGMILIVKMAVELPLLAAIAWDSAEISPPLIRNALLDGLWTASLIASLAYLNYLMYFIRNGYGPVEVMNGSVLHYGAASLGMLTIGLCILVNTLHYRSERGVFSSYQTHNHIFLLGCGISVLLIAILTTLLGPLTAQDWLLGLAAAVAFGIFREVQLYADRQHSRDVLLKRLNEQS